MRWTKEVSSFILALFLCGCYGQNFVYPEDLEPVQDQYTPTRDIEVIGFGELNNLVHDIITRTFPGLSALNRVRAIEVDSIDELPDHQYLPNYKSAAHYDTSNNEIIIYRIISNEVMSVEDLIIGISASELSPRNVRTFTGINNELDDIMSCIAHEYGHSYLLRLEINESVNHYVSDYATRVNDANHEYTAELEQWADSFQMFLLHPEGMQEIYPETFQTVYNCIENIDYNYEVFSACEFRQRLIWIEHYRRCFSYDWSLIQNIVTAANSKNFELFTDLIRPRYQSRNPQVIPTTWFKTRLFHEMRHQIELDQSTIPYYIALAYWIGVPGALELRLYASSFDSLDESLPENYFDIFVNGIRGTTDRERQLEIFEIYIIIFLERDWEGLPYGIDLSDQEITDVWLACYDFQLGHKTLLRMRPTANPDIVTEYQNYHQALNTLLDEFLEGN